MSIDDRLPDEPDVGATAGHGGPPEPTRRGFLKAAGVGGALVAGGSAFVPLLSGTAGAQSSASDAAALFEVAMTIEYAAAQLYEEAIAGGSLDDEALGRIREFGPNHQVHGDSIADALASTSTDESFDVTKLQLPNPKLYSTFRDRLEGATGLEATLGILQELESILAATHLVTVTTMDNPTDAKVIASVHMVDAQQEVVLARLLSRPLDQYTPTLESTDGALDPEAYR